MICLILNINWKGGIGMLDNNELTQIKGGISKLAIGLGIGSLLTFLLGIIDGYQRPIKCN